MHFRENIKNIFFNCFLLIERKSNKRTKKVSKHFSELMFLGWIERNKNRSADFNRTLWFEFRIYFSGLNVIIRYVLRFWAVQNQNFVSEKNWKLIFLWIFKPSRRTSVSLCFWVWSKSSIVFSDSSLRLFLLGKTNNLPMGFAFVPKCTQLFFLFPSYFFSLMPTHR